MAIRYLQKHAVLEGVVGVEDAEGLLQWLRGREDAAVGLGRCTHVHAATLQVLLALRPRLVDAPEDPWLARVLGVTRTAQPAEALS
jgi:hypothetical protein